jgi:hypothetical protein
MAKAESIQEAWPPNTEAVDKAFKGFAGLVTAIFAFPIKVGGDLLIKK